MLSSLEILFLRSLKTKLTNLIILKLYQALILKYLPFNEILYMHSISFKVKTKPLGL